MRDERRGSSCVRLPLALRARGAFCAGSTFSPFSSSPASAEACLRATGLEDFDARLGADLMGSSSSTFMFLPPSASSSSSLDSMIGFFAARVRDVRVGAAAASELPLALVARFLGGISVDAGSSSALTRVVRRGGMIVRRADATFVAIVVFING